jgi:uncharacterized protein involved in response to NO
VKKSSELVRLAIEEPFRIFFPLGILLGAVGVSHWIAYPLGWMRHYSAFFHSSVQMQAYMASFVIGFLGTAMPRLSGAPHATRTEVAAFFILLLAIAVFHAFGRWLAGELCFVALLLALFRFAFVRFRRKSPDVSPPVDFVWVPVAILHGVAGTLLLMAGQSGSVPAWAVGVGKGIGWCKLPQATRRWKCWAARRWI